MAFDYIFLDFGGVTRRKIGGHAEAFPDSLEVGSLLNGNGEPGPLEMSDPPRAAAAGRILMDANRVILGEGGTRSGQGRGYQPECAAPRQTVRTSSRWRFHGFDSSFDGVESVAKPH